MGRHDPPPTIMFFCLDQLCHQGLKGRCVNIYIVMYMRACVRVLNIEAMGGHVHVTVFKQEIRPRYLLLRDQFEDFLLFFARLAFEHSPGLKVTHGDAA